MENLIKICLWGFVFLMFLRAFEIIKIEPVYFIILPLMLFLILCFKKDKDV